ncbi:MAG: PIN domain-containing protein [Methyloprofundus sp.]|nr:PIN domain-containing protein [Methyloprofundus sp.]
MANYRYLLDTNIVSELIKKPQGAVAERMLSLGLELQCCTSIIVACELRYGAAKKQSPKLSFNVEQVLNSLPILPLEESTDEVYAKIRVNLESRGLPIGLHDLLIAAHALSLGLTVVTASEREFTRVENLRVENWITC